MIFKVIIFLGGTVLGAFFSGLYAAKAARWTNGEVLLITQEIEKIKATDIARYNSLVSEWKGLISNSKAKVSLASADMQLIIAAVKHI